MIGEVPNTTGDGLIDTMLDFSVESVTDIVDANITYTDTDCFTVSVRIT